jgi:hypothetical protein
MAAPAGLQWLVDLGDDAVPSGCCCCCPATGLVATATHQRAGAAVADVWVLEPADPSRVARLQTPLAGEAARMGSLCVAP